MATAELIPPLFQVETVKKMVEPGYVSLKLTQEEASALKALVIKAVAWKASGEFGARMESVWYALQRAGVPAELGLRCEPDDDRRDGFAPRDRIWVKRF